VVEIAKGKPVLHLRFCLNRQLNAIALRQGEERRWLDRTFEVDVQFSFGDGGDVAFDTCRNFHTSQ
jgi:hypothetical protein